MHTRHHKHSNSGQSQSQSKASATKTPDAAGTTAPANKTISAEEVRVCAYRKWESAGRPIGDGIQFWLEAERELIHGR